MKQVKDPVYGYISLENEICTRCIDTPEFQRLRRIVQTSYAPLYPSALHNRFVHSLGVYFLGCRASAVLDKSVRRLLHMGSEDIEPSEEDSRVIYKHWQNSRETFETACLLHDFGHAPFSHSGEVFFASQPKDLDDQLKAVVGDPTFSMDVDANAATRAKNHEIMSAILGIERFGDHIKNRSLFARAITGYRYQAPLLSPDLQLDNALIQMLNSNTIDVDKLDYLVRDAYVVGFDSVNLDYVRLLDGLRIIKNTIGDYELAYHKSALSVLENVVYARDFEKKWIQSHPVILYDQMLIKHAIQEADSKVRAKGAFTSPTVLFSKDALTSNGVTGAGGEHVRWVSDEDVLFIAKNRCTEDSLVEEYFARNERRHPLWKSEAEYRAIFGDKNSTVVHKIKELMYNLEKYLLTSGKAPLLNASLIASLESERQKINDDNENEKELAQQLDEWITLLKYLENFCDKTICSTMNEGINAEPSIDFDFVLIASDTFESGFKGDSFNKIRIVFSDEESAMDYCFSDVSNHIKYENAFNDASEHIKYENESEHFYYLFHKRAGKPDFPKNDFINCLITHYTRK